MCRYILLLLVSMITFADLQAQGRIRSSDRDRERIARERAQRKGTQAEEKEEPEAAAPKSNFWKDDVWYGGNLGLGFAGNDFASSFFLGLAPMAGYKITPDFSVGPRVEFQYTYYKLSTSRGIQKFNLYSGGIGPFVRYKFLGFLFLHGEYQVAWTQLPYFNGIEYAKQTELSSNLFAGLGYNSGGGEILVLYNFLQPKNTLEVPITLRFGFTINF